MHIRYRCEILSDDPLTFSYPITFYLEYNVNMLTESLLPLIMQGMCKHVLMSLLDIKYPASTSCIAFKRDNGSMIYILLDELTNKQYTSIFILVTVAQSKLTTNTED